MIYKTIKIMQKINQNQKLGFTHEKANSDNLTNDKIMNIV